MSYYSLVKLKMIVEVESLENVANATMVCKN